MPIPPTPPTPPAARRAFPDEAARWAALRARDRAADGAFFYGVRTTGVFCRPICASRCPRRENVVFFDSAAQATRAGYRACKRCAPARAPAPVAGVAALVQACRLLESESLTRSDAVARAVGLSPWQLVRVFKRQLGVTPQAYRRRVLAERAKRELAAGPSVTTALYAAGYASASRFYDGAARELGMAPREARRGAAGKRVHYATRHCSLGVMLIAWTARGACEVAFGDGEAALTASLLERFPHAACAPSAAPRWVAALVDSVERPCSLDVPLDIRGTAFQQRVWEALRRIPPGETRSYAEVADALGSRALARAVARACAQNRLALLVPCHRVVRADGQPAGYRWGPARKRELLRREGSAFAPAAPRGGRRRRAPPEGRT